jgi:hypothetical protein
MYLSPRKKNLGLIEAIEHIISEELQERAATAAQLFAAKTTGAEVLSPDLRQVYSSRLQALNVRAIGDLDVGDIADLIEEYDDFIAQLEAAPVSAPVSYPVPDTGPPSPGAPVPEPPPFVGAAGPSPIVLLGIAALAYMFLKEK